MTPSDPQSGPGSGKETNLLFGVFAVQLHLVSPDQFVETAAAWVANPDTPLGQRLVDTGILNRDQYDLVMRLVDAAIEHHGADAGRALETFGGEGTLLSIINLGTLGDDSGDLATRLGLPAALDVGDSTGAKAMRETPGRYTQRSEFSRGGMGRILLVHDAYLARDIALKELLPARIGSSASTQGDESPMAFSGRMVARFLREAKITGQLEHPNIVPVYELGQRDSGGFYYTMKLVRGETFARRLRNAANLGERLRLLPHLLDLCNAIGYAHSRNVIHRDIKPANVLVGAFGETVVIDWGLAKVVGAAEDPAADELRTSMESLHDQASVDDLETQTGVQLGTPAYMSPEQARGAIPDVDERSDVFSLGMVLYEMLAGRLPFEGEGVSAILNKIASTDPVPMPKAVAEANPELAGICRKALAKDKADRYQNAGELAADLERFLSGILVQAYSYSRWELWKRFYRRNRPLVNLSAASAAALLLIGLFAYYRVSEARDIAVAERERAERSEYITSIQLANSLVEQRRFDAANDTLLNTDPERRGWEWGFLYNRCHSYFASLGGHPQPVSKAIYNSDGSLIATATNRETVRVWDAETNEVRYTMTEPEYRISDIAFSPDGTQVAVAQYAPPVLVWTPANDGMIEITGTLAGARGLTFLADGALLVGYEDGALRIWNPADGELIQQLPSFDEPINQIVTSADGAVVGVRDASGQVRIYRAGADSQYQQAFETEAGHIGLSGDGTRLVISQDNQLRLVSTDNGAIQEELEPYRPAAGVAVNADGTMVAAGYEDGIVRVYRTGEAAPWLTFDLEEPILQIGLTGDDSAVVACSREGLLAEWDLHENARPRRFLGHSAAIENMDIHPTLNRAITASDDLTAKVWELSDPIWIAESEDLGGTTNLAISPAEDFIATYSKRGALEIVESKSLKRITSYRATWLPGYGDCAWSSDGRFVVCAIDSFTPIVIDLSTDKIVCKYLGHAGEITDLIWIPNSDSIYSASTDGTLQKWNGKTGQKIDEIDSVAAGVNRLALSADGELLAAGSNDGTTRAWSPRTGEEIGSFEGVSSPVRAIACTQDAQYVVSAHEDKSSFLLSSALRLLPVVSVDRNVTAQGLSFDQAETRLFTSALDGTVSVWSMEDFALLLEIGISSGACWDVESFSKDASLIISTQNGPMLLARGFGSPAVNSAGDSPENLRQAHEAFRRRVLESNQRHEAGSSKAVIYSARNFMTETIERIIATSNSDAQTVSFAEAQVEVTAATPESAFPLLGIESGDAFIDVNGRPIASKTDMIESFSEIRQGIADAQLNSFRMSILRENAPFGIHVYVSNVETIERTVTLERTQAVRLAQSMLTSIEMNAAFIGRQSRANARHLGLGANTPIGLWIFVSRADTIDSLLREIGIGAGDRLWSVNGEFIDGVPGFREKLSHWLDELNAGKSEPIEFAFDRGAFVRYILTLDVG